MLSVRLMFANGCSAQSSRRPHGGLAGAHVDVRDVAQHLAAALRLPARARASARRSPAGASGTRRPMPSRARPAPGSRPRCRRARDRAPPRAQDHGLARDVHARQVVARVGLGIAARLRLAHDLGERALAVEHIEQIRERAGENAADAADLVAGLDEVLERLDHRQARADRRLVEEMRARRAAQALQVLVVRDRRRCARACSA